MAARPAHLRRGSDGLACAHPGDRVDSPSVGGARRFNQRWALCYAKRPQKPIDYDLYVGRRPRHDRPDAYGHPTNESVPLAHNSCRPKLIAPSELAEASVGQNAAYAEAVRTGRRRKKRAPEPAILRARSQIANGPKND